MDQLNRVITNRAFIAAASFMVGLAANYGAQKMSHSAHSTRSPFVSSPDLFSFNDDPFEQMENLHKKMQEQIFKGISSPIKMGESADVTDLKVREDDHYIYYDIVVPDLNEKNVKVQVEDGQVTVSGKTEKKSEAQNQQAFFSSAFHRSFPAPTNVDPTKVKIQYDKDKVIVQFPKDSDQGSFT